MAKIDKTEVSGIEYVLSEITNLRREIKANNKSNAHIEAFNSIPQPLPMVSLHFKVNQDKTPSDIVHSIMARHNIIEWRIEGLGDKSILSIKAFGQPKELARSITADFEISGIACTPVWNN